MNRYIMDYLFEQVFINQPLEIQKFLMFTSILERFSAGLCDAVMACGENDYFPRNEKFEKTKWVGLSRTVDIISYLETHNLFFNILGQDRSWFCYHDLFAEMLQTRLQEDYPKSISDLHLCAAKWLIDNDFFIDAVHHLISGGFMDKAIALVAKVLPIQLAKKDLTLIQIADSLPLDLVATEPRLCLYLIWHNVIHGEIKKTRDLLSRLTANIPNTNGFAGNEWITAFVTCVEAFLSPIAESDLSFTLPKYDFFENIPEEDLVLREAAEYFYAMALGRRGKINAAVDVSIRSIQNSHPHRHPSQAPTLAPFLSRVYLMQGFLNKTFTLCQEFLPTLENDNQSIYYTSGSMRIDLGEVFYHRNDLDKAESYIRDGLRVNKLWQNVMTEGFGLAALTRVLLSKGEISQAKECIDAFNRNYPSRNSPRELLDDILTLELTFLLASGELNKAIEWADQIKHRLDFQENKSIYQIAIARVRLNEKRYDCVENLLAEIDYRVGSGNIVAKNIEVELMRALAGFLAGEKLKAFFHLDQCLAIAEPEGYVRIFLDFGLVVNNLLLEYIGERGKAANLFAKEVLAALSSQSNSKLQITRGPLLDPLTNREIEVLQHIAAGLTNREVAGVLVISPGTVKAHTSSIYRKLGASNRTEAVNLAREIGILRQ